MLNILFGPPGSGKTTAIQQIQRHYPLKYISVGAIYRNEIERETDFSEILRRYVESNINYPKDIIRKIIEPKLLSIDRSDVSILDGFPRHENEIEVLHELLQVQKDALPGYVIILTLSQDTAKRRIANRRVCGICDYHADKEDICPRCGNLMEKRHDDDMDQFDDRFTTYAANNEVLISRLAQMSFTPVYIDANESKQKVYNDMLDVLLINQQDDKSTVSHVSRTIQANH